MLLNNRKTIGNLTKNISNKPYNISTTISPLTISRNPPSTRPDGASHPPFDKLRAVLRFWPRPAGAAVSPSSSVWMPIWPQAAKLLSAGTISYISGWLGKGRLGSGRAAE
jgi:hypothetical protein